MKNLVIAGVEVFVTTACVIGVVNCSAQNVKVLTDDSSFESTPVYNPKNGHYYEFVGKGDLTWTEAKQQAESRFLVVERGKTWRGYLATVTQYHEQALLEKHYADPPTVHTDVWLGASDERVDDEWRWVTGPDGKEDGGKGKLFFKNGRPHGYMNWRSGEPNNSGGIESFLQWNHYLRKGDVPGTWNDQPIDKPGSKGYFVEYGGT